MSTELMEWGIPALIFVVVASGFYSLIARQLEDHRQRKALRSLQDEDLTRNDLLLGELTPALAAQLPITTSDQDEIDKELRTAGYYSKTAMLEYAAVRTVLVVVPMVATGFLALMVENEQMNRVLVVGLIVAGLGYSLPRIYLHLKGKERIRKLENALPVTVDMLALCLSGGQTLQASMHRVAREIAPAHPLMASELAITRQHAELSSLPHALKQLADRIPVGEVRNLALIMAQAERLGSETGTALLEYSNTLRTGLKQRADARANQAMFWMLFPTILCLWIPAAILLVGPAILEFRSRRQNITKEWRECRQKLRESNSLL
ncbi:MAG TPA: type II secretion system F family protein [Gemmatales bacterium]|nr:type II secretion system F family protein [Gemmatales bacterium]